MKNKFFTRKFVPATQSLQVLERHGYYYMKKFMKVCAITALILLIIGLVMAIVAGGMKGTSGISELVDSVTKGKVNINLGSGDGWGVSLNGNDWLEEEIHYDIMDKMIFDSAFDIFEGDVEKYAVGNQVQKLDIEAGGCAFYFRESEDDNFYVKGNNVGKLQCYEKNGTLFVKTTGTDAEWTGFNHSEINLYIPADFRFEHMDVEMGAGLFEVGKIAANELNLEVGAGQIVVKDLQADHFDVEVGMGEILVENMQVTKVNGEVGMGHLQLNGTILGDVKAECAMGAMELNLTGSEEDFNYTIEAAMGNITVDGADYSGIGQNRTVKNGAGKNMNLECAMGNVVVEFEN